MEGLRERRGLSFLFVSHDLGVVRHFCDRLCVMYLGRIVEEGVTADVLDRPMHPYTKLLRDSSPVPDPKARLVMTKIMGEVPSAGQSAARLHLSPALPARVRSLLQRVASARSIAARTGWSPAISRKAGRSRHERAF